MPSKFSGALVWACAVLLAASAPVIAGTLTGSKHDFHAMSWNASGQVCNVCHTPHSSSSTLPVALWNHASGADAASFTMYSTASGQTGTLQPASKVCLSCHDGTVGSDAFGGSSGTNAAKITGKANMGTNLSDDHPIGVTYTGGTLNSNTTALSLDPGGGGAVKNGTIANLLLFGSGPYVECSSCHDVHNTFTGAANYKMVKAFNPAKDLCLVCHNK